MGRPVAVTKVLTAASDNCIALSQTPLAAGFLTLAGAAASAGVATLDTGRRVIITSAGNDSDKTFTIRGTREGGGRIMEVVTGANIGVAASNLDFLTVTSIYASAATAAAVKAGTNGVGSSRWVRFDPHLTPPNISFAVELVSGSGNVTVEETYDEFLAPAGVQSAVGYEPATTIPTAIADPQLVSITVSQQGGFNSPFSGWRLTVNSGTGSWKCTGTQAGLAGP